MAKMLKTPVSVDPQILFQYAEAFAQAVEFLAPQFKRAAQPLDKGIVGRKINLHVSITAETAPFMIVDTFALELYFKCLYAMDHGVLIRGHDIKTIYKKLKRRTKHRLKKNYDRTVSKSDLPGTMQKRSRSGFTNLNLYLGHSRRAFEEVRYLFERVSERKIPIRYWSVLRQAARSSVLDIMPEWAGRNPPTYLLL